MEMTYAYSLRKPFYLYFPETKLLDILGFGKNFSAFIMLTILAVDLALPPSIHLASYGLLDLQFNTSHNTM